MCNTLVEQIPRCRKLAITPGGGKGHTLDLATCEAFSENELFFVRVRKHLLMLVRKHHQEISSANAFISSTEHNTYNTSK